MNRITVRDSNMELLRIIAMMLVLIFHANYLALGKPSCADAISEPISTFMQDFVQAISQVCVNIFVLISGWYGIKFNFKKVFQLLFQVIFFALIIWCVLVILFPQQYLNYASVGTIFMINSSDYWFVKAYLGLMIIAPVLNMFIEKSSKLQLLWLVIAFYIMQTIYGWLSLYGAQWIEGGYSAWSFIGLYLLARYLKLYPCKISSLNVKYDFLIYLCIAILLSIVAFALSYNGIDVAGRLVCSYTNPLSILEAVFLMLAFSKLRFKSIIINWIASSCIAVYLLHANELVLRTYYGPFVKYLNENYSLFWFLLYVVIFLFLIFVISVLIDKIRMILWHMIDSKISYKN